MNKVIPLSSAVKTVCVPNRNAADIVGIESDVPRESSPRFQETIIHLRLPGSSLVRVHIPRGVSAIDLYQHIQLLVDQFFRIHDGSSFAADERMLRCLVRARS